MWLRKDQNNILLESLLPHRNEIDRIIQSGEVIQIPTRVNTFTRVFRHTSPGTVVRKEYILYFEDCNGSSILSLENWFAAFFKVSRANYLWSRKVASFRRTRELGTRDPQLFLKTSRSHACGPSARKTY